MAIDLLAERDANPAFRQAIFLDIVALLALEADADAALKQRLIEKRAARIGREAIGGRVGHGERYWRTCTQNASPPTMKKGGAIARAAPIQ